MPAAEMLSLLHRSGVDPHFALRRLLQAYLEEPVPAAQAPALLAEPQLQAQPHPSERFAA